MDAGAWQVTFMGLKESDATERLSTWHRFPAVSVVVQRQVCRMIPQRVERKVNKN